MPDRNPTPTTDDADGPIRAVMSAGAVTVDARVTLRTLAAVLSELGIGAAVLPRPAGEAAVVSERDIVRALAEGADPDEVWADDVAADDLVTAEPEEAVGAVAARMAAEGVRHIAVVERGTIIGVVSARDVLPVLAAAANDDF